MGSGRSHPGKPAAWEEMQMMLTPCGHFFRGVQLFASHQLPRLLVVHWEVVSSLLLGVCKQKLGE